MSVRRVPVVVGRVRGETGAAVLRGRSRNVAQRWRPGDGAQSAVVPPAGRGLRVAADGDHLAVHLLHLGRDNPVAGGPLVLGQERAPLPRVYAADRDVVLGDAGIRRGVCVRVRQGCVAI